MDDDQQWTAAQLAWRSPRFDGDYDVSVQEAARAGNLDALSMMLGCWEAPPKIPERPEPGPKLDTAPRGRGRLRPALIRHGREVPLTQYWTEYDREENDAQAAAMSAFDHAFQESSTNDAGDQ